MKRSAEASPDCEDGCHPSPRDSPDQPQKRRRISDKEEPSRPSPKVDMQLPTPANSFEECDRPSTGQPIVNSSSDKAEPLVSSSPGEGVPLELPPPPPDIEEGVDWGFVPGYASSNDSRGVGENGLHDPSSARSELEEHTNPESRRIPESMSIIIRKEAILKSSRLQKADRICTEEEKASLAAAYGASAFDRISRLAEKASPAIGENFEEATRNFGQPKSESAFVNGELPLALFSGPKTVQSPQQSSEDKKRPIELLIDRQTELCGSRFNASEAFLFWYANHVSGSARGAYNTLNRVADFSIALTGSICDEIAYTGVSSKTIPGFPCAVGPKRCLSSSSEWPRSIIPFATGEVKVNKPFSEARTQLDFHATYAIMAWITARALHADQTAVAIHPSTDPSTSQTRDEVNPLHTIQSPRAGEDATPAAKSNPYRDIYQGVCHYGLTLAPNSLEIWQYTPLLNEQYESHLDISAKLLCAGSPVDQHFVEEVYIPWRRHTLQRAVIMQLLYYIPAINSFYSRPDPLPFHDEEKDYPLFIHVNNFVPDERIKQNALFNPYSKGTSREDLYKIVTETKEKEMKAAESKKRKTDSGTEPSDLRSSMTRGKVSLGPLQFGEVFLKHSERREEGGEATGEATQTVLSQSATPAMGMSFNTSQ